MPTAHPHPLLSSQPFTRKGKIVTAEEAVRLIRDGDAVVTGGFVGIGFAEYSSPIQVVEYSYTNHTFQG